MDIWINMFVDREHKKTVEDHHHAAELTREKHESQLNFARKEHQLTVTKDNDTIMSLEQQISQLKQVPNTLSDPVLTVLKPSKV